MSDINIYLETNLFGLDCPIQDTSYVLYNLFKRKWKEERGILRPTQHQQHQQQQHPSSSSSLPTTKGVPDGKAAPSVPAAAKAIAPLVGAVLSSPSHPTTTTPTAPTPQVLHIPTSPTAASISSSPRGAGTNRLAQHTPQPTYSAPAPLSPSASQQPPEDQSGLGASEASATTGTPATTVGQVILPFIKAVHDMEQLPLSDVTQRASRRRFLASFYASSLPPAAKKLVEAISSVNDTIRLDVFETPLPTSQVGRSARVGIQSSVRGGLSKLRTLKEGIEGLLNELNEIAEQEEEELPEKERELEECEGGGKASRKKKSDEDEEAAAAADLRREALERDRDELYDVCDQVYTDLLLPRIEVAETLLLSRSALALRTDDLCSFANKAIQLCYKVNVAPEIGKLPSFGALLWEKYTSGTPSQEESPSEERVPLSWLTNAILDECEEAMVDAHNSYAQQRTDEADEGDDDAAAATKEAHDTERKSLICLRTVVQEVSEQSRFMMDAIGGLCGVFVALEAATDEDLEGGLEGSMGFQLDAICDKLLALGLMDAEMWLQDLIRTASIQRDNSRKFNPSGSTTAGGMGGSRKGSFGASLKQSIVKRTMSFGGGGGGMGSSMKGGGGSPPTMQRSLSGVLTPKKRMSMPSMHTPPHNVVGDEMMTLYDSDGEEDGMGMGKSIGGDSSFLLSGSSTGGVAIGNSIEMLVQRLDGILGTPPPQSTSECLAVTSRLYDTLGRINMFLRRNGMAQETKVTAAGKVVPTASDENKVYLEHATDEAQGFSKTESVLYEQGCLCFEMWSQQNRVRQELDELSIACDDEFFRTCHDDLLANLLSKADEYCVITDSRTAVAKRLDRLMVVRVKIYHHSGEVRVLTLPQRTTLSVLQQQLAEYLPDIDTCDVFFLDDGDRVRISTDKEFEDLMRMRRSVVLEGMSLGASQLGKSLMSSNELKLELYLDPSLTRLPTKKVASPATAAANRSALSSGPPPTRIVSSSSAPNKGAAAAYKSLPPPDDYRQQSGGLSLNEMIRKQEQEDAAKGVEYQTGSVDLTKFFDRKMAEKGLGAAQGDAGGVRGAQPPHVPTTAPLRTVIPEAISNVGVNKPKPVVVPPIPRNQQQQQQPQGGGPGEVLIFINKKQEEEHERKKAAAQTRNLFLAMGGNNNHNNRGGGGNEQPPSGPGYHTMDPSAVQQIERMKRMGGRGGLEQQHEESSLGSSLRSPRETVSISSKRQSNNNLPSTPVRPSSHAGGTSSVVGGYTPGKSVAIPSNRQWNPNSHNESLQFAQHQMQGSARVTGAKEMLEKYLADDDDEPEVTAPSWGRGHENHVQAVLYGGGGSAGSPLRHNGPSRRTGVPLPPQARPSSKR